MRSTFALMNLRRAAEADTTSAKAPGRNASQNRHTHSLGNMTVRDVLRTGGLRALIAKETER